MNIVEIGELFVILVQIQHIVILDCAARLAIIYKRLPTTFALMSVITEPVLQKRGLPEYDARMTYVSYDLLLY